MRADILATTRRLLAEHGFDGVKTSAVAQAHGITVQTIYNNFGPKYELIRQALEDHSELLNSFCWKNCHSRELFVIYLFFCYYKGTVENPDFYRQMMLCSFSSKRPLFPYIHKHATKIKIEPMRSMSRAGLLRPSIDPQMLSEQVTQMNSYTMLEWANNSCGVMELFDKLYSFNALLLLGALQQPFGKLMEKWLANFENRTEKDPLSALERAFSQPQLQQQSI